MSRARWAGLAAHLALIGYASTAQAGAYASYASDFYQGLVGGQVAAVGAGLAQKAVHFALFFALGSWLWHGLRHPQRLIVVCAACLAVGSLSELEQMFTMRHASWLDVALNAASGSLAALWLRRATGT
jgi:VanZ family protein